MLEKTQFFGDNPLARFGHTITPIGKQKAILFGGAVGDTGKYVITADTFLCNYPTKKWKKLENKGTPPSVRAAHCSVTIDHFFFVYGGALGGGQLADDNLYQLDLSSVSDKAYWNIMKINGPSPGARYGHIMVYLKPFLIVQGGNTGSQPVGDIWAIQIFSAATWKKIDTVGQAPPARVYHSASICRTGTASGMMVIFGGRGVDQAPLNDTWGLRKHRDGRLDWMKAPYKNIQSQPAQRYQHKTLFIGSLLLVIGGRNNSVGQSMPLDIYDTDSSDWYRLPNIERFRHACFLEDGNIYIYGGFDQISPSIPTQSIVKIDLNKAFNKYPNLYKGLAFELGKQMLSHNSPNLVKKQSHQFGYRNYTGQPKKRVDKMQLQYQKPIKRNIQTNKSIRLCPQAIVANFDDQKDIKKIYIDQLPTENRRLTGNIILANSKEQYQNVLRFFLNNLFCKQTAHIGFPIPSQYIEKLLDKVQKIIQQEPNLLKLRMPVKIFGDIHGQINQLNRYFQAFGSPCDDLPNGDIQFTNYLFLGDYIDRGTKSVQTMLLLFALKLKYPQNVFLLRGSHQDRFINRHMGFGDECMQKFKENIDDQNSFYQRCNRIFQKMSIAALIDEDIFCVHGGIGGTIKFINDVEQIKKPYKVNHEPKTKIDKIIYEILWTDPCKENQVDAIVNNQHNYFKSEYNCKFSEDRVVKFCQENDLITIIRSHQPLSEGFQSKQMLVTVFSISDYGNMGNKGGILHAKKNSEFAPKILNPISTRQRWLNLEETGKKNHMDDKLRHIGFTPIKK